MRHNLTLIVELCHDVFGENPILHMQTCYVLQKGSPSRALFIFYILWGIKSRDLFPVLFLKEGETGRSGLLKESTCSIMMNVENALLRKERSWIKLRF